MLLLDWQHYRSKCQTACENLTHLCMSQMSSQDTLAGAHAQWGSWVLSPRALVFTTAKRKLKRFPAKYPCHLFDFVRRLCDKDKTVITLLQKRTWPGCHSDLERHTGQDTDTNLLQNLQNLPFISQTKSVYFGVFVVICCMYWILKMWIYKHK